VQGLVLRRVNNCKFVVVCAGASTSLAVCCFVICYMNMPSVVSLLAALA
jgi:hypothetical protein